MTIYCLSSDLMMTGKISSLARSQDIPCQIFANSSALLSAIDAESSAPMLWLVDLQRCDQFQALAEQARHVEAGVELIGYAQHVLPEILAEAESAGFAKVMTRGQFDRQVVAIIHEFVESSADS